MSHKNNWLSSLSSIWQTTLCPPDCWLKSQPSRPGQMRPSRPFHSPEVDFANSPSLEEISLKIYKPLREHETRVVELKPGHTADPLICSLVTLNLSTGKSLGRDGEKAEDEFVYEALSYCWGKPIFNKRISVDGHPYAITASLDRGLRNLRRPDKSRYLWIDALVINQHDEVEKSEQVRQMLFIYEKAARVIAWLDIPDLGFVGSDLELLAAFPYTTRNETFYSAAAAAHDPECLARLKGLYLSLGELSNNEWFRRTWIRQEAFMAKGITLQIGRTVIDWDSFNDVLHWLHHPSDSRSSFRNEVYEEFYGLQAQIESLVRSLQVLKTDHQSLKRTLKAIDGDGGRGVLPWLLLNGNQFGVTDPRDKVYAVLGMAQKMASMIEEGGVERDAQTEKHIVNSTRMTVEQLPISYRKTLSEVFQDVIKYSIASRNDLTILELCTEPGNRADEFPSWVLDWRKKISAPEVFWYKVKHWTTSVPPRPQQWDNVWRLELEGVRAGTIRREWPVAIPRIDADWISSLGRPMYLADCLMEPDEKPAEDAKEEVSEENSTSKQAELDESTEEKAEKSSKVPPNPVPEESEADQDQKPPGGKEKEAPLQDERKFLAITDTKPTKGDIIVLLHGGRVPFILRPQNKRATKKTYTLIGRVIAIGPAFNKEMYFDSRPYQYSFGHRDFRDFIVQDFEWLKWTEESTSEEFIIV